MRRGTYGARRERSLSKRGASQLAHTSLLERPREDKRGPDTGNLLLYTRPEIRMYHSRTRVDARARVCVCAREHERAPVVGLIHTRRVRRVGRTTESSYTNEGRFTIEELRCARHYLWVFASDTLWTIRRCSEDEALESPGGLWRIAATGPNAKTSADYADDLRPNNRPTNGKTFP